jgi:hypothetical protein
MAVDTSLLEHWRSEQDARRRARASLPPRVRVDGRPQMQLVADRYVESLVEMRRRKTEKP